MPSTLWHQPQNHRPKPLRTPSWRVFPTAFGLFPIDFFSMPLLLQTTILPYSKMSRCEVYHFTMKKAMASANFRNFRNWPLSFLSTAQIQLPNDDIQSTMPDAQNRTGHGYGQPCQALAVGADIFPMTDFLSSDLEVYSLLVKGPEQQPAADGERQRRGEQAQSKCNPYFHESFLSRSATPSRPGDGTPDCGRSRPVRYESLHPDSRRHWIIPFRDFGSRRARATQSSQQAAKTTNVPAKHFAFSPSTGKRKTVRTRPTRMWTK